MVIRSQCHADPNSEKVRAMAASPKAYRDFAQDCLRGAAETKSERHRQILLEMAKTWMQAALEEERSLGLTDDLPMPTHKPALKPPK
jgi:hypothetical protein